MRGKPPAPEAPRPVRATAVGVTAILMWSTLALLTTLTGRVPPLQLTALAFTVATAVGLVYWFREGSGIRLFTELPGPVWLLGVGGLFGYHLFYFMALRLAPAAEASLIAYLWPLLIVLMASALPGEGFRWFHLVGALTGFVGVIVLIGPSDGLGFSWQYLPGYAAALVCALTWSTYSVLSRRWGEVPTAAVGGFCGVTAILAWISHALTESTAWPVGWQWVAVAALGLGPVGLAFFVWDHGVKKGNIKTLGALSYLAPLVSTVLLVVAGRAEPTWALGVACLLIVGGAVLASGDLLGSESRNAGSDS